MHRRAGQSGRAIATRAWSLAEATSAIGIKVRRKDISATTAPSALDLLDGRIVSLPDVVDPPAALFRRAGLLLRDFALGLRAGHAPHLAICLDLAQVALATADVAPWPALPAGWGRPSSRSIDEASPAAPGEVEAV